MGNTQERTRVRSLDDIEPGDHISWDRGVYHHHAIVTDVRPNKEKVKVAEYIPDEKRSLSGPGKAIITYHWISIDCATAKLYVYDHNSNKRVTVDRALSRVDEREYHLLFNNCESFANWCATGFNISKQAIAAAFGVPLGLLAFAIVLIVFIVVIVVKIHLAPSTAPVPISPLHLSGVRPDVLRDFLGTF